MDVFQDNYYDRYYDRPAGRYEEREPFDRRLPPLPPRDMGARRDFLPPPIPPREPLPPMGMRGPPSSLRDSFERSMFSRRSPPPPTGRFG